MVLNHRFNLLRPRANGRRPSSYPTDGVGMPLRITRLFPMKLKEVTVKTLKEEKHETDVVCITQMMSLFDCFERNEFDRTLCKQHVDDLELCYSSYLKNKNTNKMKK